MNSRGQYDDVRLVLLGGVRNRDDERVLAQCKAAARALRLTDTDTGTDRVEFVENASYPALTRWYQSAAVGLHTMWNEHFGISVVEMMAAGLVVVAHNSAGPAMDIVSPTLDADPLAGLGYLAATAEEYAECLKHALDLTAPSPHAEAVVGVDVVDGVDGDCDDNNSSSSNTQQRLRRRISSSASRFSDENFSNDFIFHMQTVF